MQYKTKTTLAKTRYPMNEVWILIVVYYLLHPLETKENPLLVNYTRISTTNVPTASIISCLFCSFFSLKLCLLHEAFASTISSVLCPSPINFVELYPLEDFPKLHLCFSLIFVFTNSKLKKSSYN